MAASASFTIVPTAETAAFLLLEILFLIFGLVVLILILILFVKKSKNRQLESSKLLQEVQNQRDSSLLNYNALLQNTPGGVAIYEYSDDRLNITFFNDALCEILGCTRFQYEQNARLHPFNLIHFEDRPPLLELVDNSIKTASRFTGVYRIIRNDKSIKWIKINGSVIKKPNSAPILHLVCLDVNTEITTSLELEQSNLLIKGMIDFSPAGMCRFIDGGDGSFDFISDNMISMLGYTREEFGLKFHNNFYHLVYIKDVERVTLELASQMKTSDRTSCEFRILCKNGDIRWFYHEGHRIKDENGVGWFYIVFLDITLQKHNDEILEQANAELQYAAEYDQLTNIYNSDSFYNKTGELLKASTLPYVLVRLNINRFKLINELFGAKSGDDVLIAIANCLREHCLPFGTICRLSADHFACCLPRENFDPQRLLNQLNSYFLAISINYPISVKLGIYEICDTSLPVVHMCDRAILALQTINGDYLANFTYYDDVLRENIVKEQVVTSEMGAALEDKQFVVFLQPIFSLLQNKTMSAEALVRWIHPVTGLVPPNSFIPIFEKNGFISKLDYYVIDETCRQLAKRKLENKPLIPVSVNVSRRSLYNPSLCDDIVAIIKRHNLNSSYIRIEITESAYMDNSGLLLGTINKLKDKGFVVLMDDFGSGYSSFNALKDIPVDILKIDMIFMRDIEFSDKGANILKSIVRMAASIDIDVIVEGVETLPQVEFLQSIGCDKIQGYYFSKPLPVDDYEKFVL